MQKVEHISTDTFQLYARRRLSAAEIFGVQNHLGECAECRQRLTTVFDQSSAFANLTNSFNFNGSDAAESEHLPYEQLALFVDGKLDDVTREIVESHFAVCAECQKDADDLRFYQNIAAAPAAAASAPTAKTFWQKIFPFDLAGAFVPAFGALAVLFAVLFGAWFFIRSTQNRGKDAAQTNFNNQIIAQSSPAPAISNQNFPTIVDSPINADNNGAAKTGSKLPATTAASAPLIALSDAGNQIELGANGNLRGLENLSAETRNAVRQTLQTGKVKIPDAAKNLSNNQTGILMSGDQTGGVPFALLTPVGKIVREQQPVLRWKPLPGATKYTVAVTDSSFRVLAQSPELTASEWTVPENLPRGAAYSWQVTAVNSAGIETVSPASPAPPARFRILDAAANNQIVQLEKSRTKSHLARGIVFARAGLLNEARREFELLRRENPRSPIARRLLR